MYSFSTRSMRNLKTAHPLLQDISKEVIKYVDFTVITGHRSEEEQNALYPKYTKVRWPNGKHNTYPSTAIDVAPYVPPFGVIHGDANQVESIMQLTGKSKAQVNSFIEKAYARLIGIFEGVAYAKFGTTLRLGIDWDHDFNTLDQTFHDLGHIELKI